MKTIYGVEPYLTVPALGLSAVSILCCLSEVFGLPIPEIWQKHLLYANVAVIVPLFLRLTFSRAHQHGVHEANADKTGSPFFQLKTKAYPLNHPEWGLWGSKFGNGLLACFRLSSFAVFIVTGLIVRDAAASVVLIAFTGFGFTVMLTHAQFVNHYPLTDDQV